MSWMKLAAFSAGLLVVAAGAQAAVCGPAVLPIGGDRIWAEVKGAGTATVVFEAGFGNDSSVWTAIEPRIRAAGVRTLVYDRAGMGKSTIDTGEPYSLDNDARILRTVLARCGVDAPVVFVGHSYGGAIGLVAAAQDRQIKGLVLLDAVVPGVWPDSEVAKNLGAMRAQYQEIRDKAPALAKVAIPFAEALPVTAREVNGLTVPDTLPIIDIVAEHGQHDPQSGAVWQQAHAAFTAGHANRQAVLAKGSSHKVMQDQPDLVVHSILAMLKQTG